MSWISVAESVKTEQASRESNLERIMTFGVKYLDDSMICIMPDDLVLLGGESGAGKTQLVCAIAEHNVAIGKKVNMLALESSLHEIERRLKFPLVLKHFMADANRPVYKGALKFAEWMTGKYKFFLGPYEAKAMVEFQDKYKNFYLKRKGSSFTVDNLIEAVLQASQQGTDLIIIDHAHYFDFDEDENRGLKKLMKTCRDLVLEEKKPIILVAHLRKPPGAGPICPSMYEFHGSSDLYKIATKVVTFAGGQKISDGYETFFRVNKNRFDSTVTKFLGRTRYKHGGGYDAEYHIGWSDQSVFQILGSEVYPEWAPCPPAIDGRASEAIGYGGGIHKGRKSLAARKGSRNF